MASVLSSAISKAGAFVRNQFGLNDQQSGRSSTNGAGKGRYLFPVDVEKYARMCIKSNSKTIPIEIFLQIPQGLAIGDTLAYGSMNLGQIGKAGQDALSKVSNAANSGSLKGVADGISETAKGVAGQVKGIKNPTVQAAALAQIANKAGLVPTGIVTAAAEAAMYNQRSVLNPNQVTTFNGSNVRSYSFAFKLVGTSAAENNTIKEMVDLLRLNAYPTGNDIVLEYPSEFTITFLKADSSDINPYIAPIYTCYLMNLTTTYNGAANAFYEDGAPLEVDISVGFQETKALTRDDLKALSNNIRFGAAAPKKS